MLANGRMNALLARADIEAAQKWIEENITSPVVTPIGEIEVGIDGIKDSFSHTIYQNKLDAVQAIVPVLQNGSYLGMQEDKDGKSIMNYYFAAKVKIGGDWKILFVRTREKSGYTNKFYVHEIYTEDEIKKIGSTNSATGADQLFRNASDFYRSLIAEYLYVNATYQVIQYKLANPKLKTYAIDDSQALMAFEMFSRAKEKGYDKFTEIAVNFYNLIQQIIRQTPPDCIVYSAGQEKACHIGGAQFKAIQEASQARNINDWQDFTGKRFPVKVAINPKPSEDKNGQIYWKNQIAMIITPEKNDYRAVRENRKAKISVWIK